MTNAALVESADNHSALPGWPVRGLMQLLSPAGARARLSILIYHRVLPRPDPLFPNELDAVRFEAQMRLLACAFRFLPLSEAVLRMVVRCMPSPLQAQNVNKYCKLL